MIFQFLMSLFVVVASVVVTFWFSGGHLGSILLEWILLVGILGISSFFVFLGGYGKSLKWLFASGKKYKSLSFSELKKIDNFFDYILKVFLYVGLFFVLIGVSVFYLNFFSIETLGFNLGTVLFSVFFVVVLEMLFLCLKSYNKRNMILTMMENPKTDIEKRKSFSWKKILNHFLRFFVVIVLLGLFCYFVISLNTVNEITLNIINWLDIPSLLIVCIPSILFLVISKNLSFFVKGVKVLVHGEKIETGDKNLLVNSISSFRKFVLLFGIFSTVIGIIAILFNLEDKNYLGINMHISIISSLYAVIFSVVLLVLESKILSLDEE